MNRKEMVQEIIVSIGTPLREEKTVRSRTQEGPSMITKVNSWMLPIILEAILAVDPTYDEQDKLHLRSWDFGLEAVILRGLSQQQAVDFRKWAMQLFDENGRGTPVEWEEIIDNLLRGRDKKSAR